MGTRLLIPLLLVAAIGCDAQKPCKCPEPQTSGVVAWDGRDRQDGFPVEFAPGNLAASDGRLTVDGDLITGKAIVGDIEYALVVDVMRRELWLSVDGLAVRLPWGLPVAIGSREGVQAAMIAMEAGADALSAVKSAIHADPRALDPAASEHVDEIMP